MVAEGGVVPVSCSRADGGAGRRQPTTLTPTTGSRQHPSRRRCGARLIVNLPSDNTHAPATSSATTPAAAAADGQSRRPPRSSAAAALASAPARAPSVAVVIESPCAQLPRHGDSIISRTAGKGKDPRCSACSAAIAIAAAATAAAADTTGDTVRRCQHEKWAECTRLTIRQGGAQPPHNTTAPEIQCQVHALSPSLPSSLPLCLVHSQRPSY
jgi:hypothetical protein